MTEQELWVVIVALGPVIAYLARGNRGWWER